MPKIIPYLAFNGNCRAAMEFYGEVFGATPSIWTFKDGPMEVPESSQNSVMHSVLQSDALHLMASDITPGSTLTVGDNVTLYLDCDSEESQNALFEALSVGGEIGMPLENAFWGSRFGMLSDQFGTNWMLSLERV